MLRLLLLTALLASGCSLASSDAPNTESAATPEAEGLLVNRTSAALVPLAFDQDMAAVIRLAGAFEITDRESIIARGEAGPLAIDGYREGEDFVVYLFRVEGDRARIEGGVNVDGKAFERDDRVLVVESF